MKKKEALSQIVGNENVFDSAGILDQYSKDRSFENPIRPRYVVKPYNVEEVQGIVTWANYTGTPLIPISSGSPHFRGDTVPSTGGSVIVDLSGMKKIIRISEQNRIAIVEPGVTFAELIPELKKNNLKLNIPLFPRSSKSVAGSLLEREPVIMPRYHWDLVDPLVCTELIYGTGDLFRTGSAAGPGTLEEQWEVGAAQNEMSGPIQADFGRLIQGAQGTMGIVTWVSIRCEQLPVLEEPFFIESHDLEKLLEFCHQGINSRLIDDCYILNRRNISNINGKVSPFSHEDGNPSHQEWILYYMISGPKYFPEEKLQYQLEEASKLTKSLGLKPVKSLGDASAYDFSKWLYSFSEDTNWKLGPRGSCYDIFFLSTCDNLSILNSVMKDAAEKAGYPVSEMGVYIQPLVQGVCYHCEYNLFFNPDDDKESNMVRELSTAALPALADAGAFFSRPYGPWADFAYNRDAQTTINLRKIKSIFDPNNIMNPGKLCFS